MPDGKMKLTLRALVEGGVDCILVGAVAAALEGAIIDTLDIDVVHSREPANVERLLTVLRTLDAIFRIQPERRLRPDMSHVAGLGHLNLITRYGLLDVPGTIGRGRGYEDLLPHTREIDIGGGLGVRVLDLETLIAVKEEVGGEKDRAVLPILRATLEEKRKLERR